MTAARNPEDSFPPCHWGFVLTIVSLFALRDYQFRGDTRVCWASMREYESADALGFLFEDEGWTSY